MPAPTIQHLTDVGQRKAMGLLSFREIEALGHTPLTLKDHFNAQSTYAVRHLKPGMPLWGDVVAPDMETLAVAHLPMLQKLIDRHHPLLIAAQWPTTAQDFFDKSLQTYILRDATPTGSALQDLIKEAYQHPRPGHPPAHKPSATAQIKKFFGLR